MCGFPNGYVRNLWLVWSGDVSIGCGVKDVLRKEKPEVAGFESKLRALLGLETVLQTSGQVDFNLNINAVCMYAWGLFVRI